MAVFVTGGTGFLGVNLVRALVADGERIRALSRPGSPRVGLDVGNIEFVEGDVADFDSVRRGMEGCDRVFHVAGWVRITPWGRDEARRVNVVGTENICRACLELGIRRLVHTSSIAAVGHGPIDAPASEESAWNLGEISAPYYDTKLEGEHVVRRYVDRGLDAVIVNPSYIVGPFDIKPTGGRVILLIATRRMRGFPARGGIGFVDVREVVEGMRAAMDRGRRGERYVLSGENLSYAAYVRLVARVAGVPAPTFAAPYWLLWPAAAIGSVLGRFWPDRFSDANLAVLRSGYCDHYVSSDKARRELGVKSWPIEGAVADALHWFERNGYLVRMP